jgi:N-methylhydantoinase A
MATAAEQLASFATSLTAAATSNRDRGWQVTYALDMRYVGQSYDLTVPVSGEELDGIDPGWLAARFDDVHALHCGHATREAEKEIITYRVSLHAPAGVPIDQLPGAPSSSSAPRRTRRVFFNQTGWVSCPVYERSALNSWCRASRAGNRRTNGLNDRIPPGFSATVDRYANMILKRDGGLPTVWEIAQTGPALAAERLLE